MTRVTYDPAGIHHMLATQTPEEHAWEVEGEAIEIELGERVAMWFGSPDPQMRWFMVWLLLRKGARAWKGYLYGRATWCWSR